MELQRKVASRLTYYFGCGVVPRYYRHNEKRRFRMQSKQAHGDGFGRRGEYRTANLRYIETEIIRHRKRWRKVSFEHQGTENG